MNIIAIIPARMASSRFAGKPLAPIHGMPMIGHVALRTRMAKSISACYVATCDELIADYCKKIEVEAVMTAKSHERCSSRVAEALLHIEAQTHQRADIIVMVQGDEPMVSPAMIDAALKPMLDDTTIQVVNLMANIDSAEELQDPNTIKVVCNHAGDAMYFSRLAIPSRMHGAYSKFGHKQVCIIPFRRSALLDFEKLQPTTLEVAESIDMLRFLEHGQNVRMVFTQTKTACVDTKEDLERVSLLMQNDLLLKKYVKEK